MIIQRADWVTCKGFTVVGVVQRVARDGSWADVKWPDNDGGTYTKRMPTRVLDVQHTITIGNLEIGPWQVTDETRRAELEGERVIAQDAIIQVGDLLDWWIWGEDHEGSVCLPGWNITRETTREEKEEYIATVFAYHSRVVRCCEYKQHERAHGPVNTVVQTWERHAFYFAESVQEALAQKGATN